MTRTTHKTAWRGDDFPPWLSPMVVKELRQGVQSGAFAWTFVALQVAMFLALSFGVLDFDATGRGPGTFTLQYFFWPIVAAAVLVIIPLRGLGAISAEQADGKLDLVRLTRLSATSIVLGKWLAIVAQGALLVTAILPYVVLRYFFGNINVIGDLVTIGWLFAGSMVVAAAAIALSTRARGLRIAIAVLALPLFVSFMEMLDNPGGRSLMGPGSWVGLLAAVVLYTAVLLEYSAAKIAPIAENHALRQRSLALAIGVVWLLVAGFAAMPTAILTILTTLPLVIAFPIGAILEQPVHLRSQAAAFARFGLPGRIAARVLTPGWATGLVFAVMMMALCLSAWWWVADVRYGVPRGETVWVMAVGGLLGATVVFPLPAVVWLPRVQNRLLPYVLVQLVCLLAFAYASVMKPYGTAWESWWEGWMWLLPLPLASLSCLLTSGRSGAMALACLMASSAVTVVVFLAVRRPWLREMRTTGQLLAEAQASKAHRAGAVDRGATA